MNLIDAAKNGDIELVQRLLDRGADVNAQDDYGNTALSNHHSISIDIVRLLLDKGADLDIKDRDGNTALMLSSYRGDTDIVKLLLESGANPNSRDNIGCTALLIASIEGHTDTVQLLLDRGANPNIPANDGDTALMMATQQELTDIVELLQKYDKADEPPDEPDRDLQKYESARDIQRRFRGNRKRRQLTKNSPTYGKMHGPATRKETIRRWIDLLNQFPDDDPAKAHLGPFDNKGGKKKRKKTKKKRKKTKKKRKKTKKKSKKKK